MIPKECKRLAEVDFPIAVVSKHSAREKSIRHGHPSTLHLWWARRPLAACRAMLLGLLLPDPCDPHCPEDFRVKARELLPRVQGIPGSKDGDLRKALLKFIGDFSNWDLSTDRTYLQVSRSLVKAAHPEETPLVVDPFAGGGSIPLEALRLGCETFASDLNPVACLILKVMLEDIPRHGPELADKLRRVGKEIKEAAEKDLKEFYPDDPDGSKPIAYLWARTVKCEAPNCGADIALIRSLWLCKKSNRKWALRHRVVRNVGQTPRVEFEIFEPRTDKEVANGTVRLARATCLCCNTVLPPDRIRSQLAQQRGGASVVFNENGKRAAGALLLAVVEVRPGEIGRFYRSATKSDYTAVCKASNTVASRIGRIGQWGFDAMPTEPTPGDGTGSVGGGYRTRKYGIEAFSDFFADRQKTSLVWYTEYIHRCNDGATKRALALALGKVVMQNNSECRWKATGESLMDAFGRQALPMVWDFAEASILSGTTGDFTVALDWICKVVEQYNKYLTGQTEMSDACQSPLPNEAADVWFTDPPYYDSVPYADLSDFFFVWLKRALHGAVDFRDPWDPANELTPKKCEAVRDEQNHRDNREKKSTAWYEKTMSQAFQEGFRVLKGNGAGSVVFAHKTTEGWEALLSGMIRGGWTITGSWPIATEMASRLRARESAALATSVHLICRPRPEDARVGDWGEVLREIPKRVGDWMERLQSEGVRGADLVFACIGPALEIYSRYSKVVDAEEREIPLGGDPEALEPHKRGFLAYVWEVVGRTALEQVLGTAEAKARNSTAGALEEDARLTALFLWTLQSTNGNGAKVTGEVSEDDEEIDEEEESPKKKKQGYSLIFDVVRRFAQPLGIHLPEWEGRVIETEKGVVRLLSVKDRAKQLFGEESISAAGFRIEEQARRDPQIKFDFAVGAEAGVVPKIKGRRSKSPQPPFTKGGKEGIKRETTTLDRVHAAMLLQASGETNALRALLKAEQERGPDFIRLANALSALYPKQSEEKRLLDAMLLAIPR